MNLPFLIAMTVLPQAPTGDVATVSFDRCLSAINTRDERLALLEDIQNSNAAARELVEAVEAAEAGIDENSTEAQITKAKLLRAEFELFKLQQQERLRKAERQMFNDALKRVEAAVKVVAKKKGCSLVVYRRKQEAPVEPHFTLDQILNAAPRSLVMDQKDSIDITDDVLVLLSQLEY
jgi:Skp family chaperone for outer membrane proteins